MRKSTWKRNSKFLRNPNSPPLLQSLLKASLPGKRNSMPEINSKRLRKNKTKSKLQAKSGFWGKKTKFKRILMIKMMMNNTKVKNKKKNKKKYKSQEMTSKIMIFFDLMHIHRQILRKNISSAIENHIHRIFCTILC